MGNTYWNCRNLTGSPICGDNVTSMYRTYDNCINLTGSPVCGNNVTSMSETYYNCRNLTGNPVCGNNVTHMYGTYWNCINITGSLYMYSHNVSNMYRCFHGKDKSRILNIYVLENSISLNTCLKGDMVQDGYVAKWTDDLSTNGCYYNTYWNIYIYPAANVAAARAANGD
jgi:hypothetical protein